MQYRTSKEGVLICQPVFFQVADQTLSFWQECRLQKNCTKLHKGDHLQASKTEFCPLNCATSSLFYSSQLVLRLNRRAGPDNSNNSECSQIINGPGPDFLEHISELGSSRGSSTFCIKQRMKFLSDFFLLVCVCVCHF